MRTILGGLRALVRAPLALVPLTAEGAVGAALVIAGIWPATGASAAGAAVFPLDVYFDLKQALARTGGWIAFGIVVVFGVAVRTLVLAATLWFADGRAGPFSAVVRRVARLAAAAAVTLVPSAVFMFTGVALRYAPFVWVGAAAGFIPAVALARRAAAADGGAGAISGRTAPEAGGFLAYAYYVAAIAAAMSVLGPTSRWLVALLVLSAGPLHALFFLGWREHARAGTYPGAGTFAVVVTAIFVVTLAAASLYDRNIRDAPPVARVSARGTLLLLGGVDSTSTTGALAEVDPRDLGRARPRTEVLSYRANGSTYGARDTRSGLDRAAAAIGPQIDAAERPRLLLGHSQASLILDRLAGAGGPIPDRSVELAGPPPTPPPASVPAPGEPGPGRPGADAAAMFARVLELFGLPGYEIASPSSPARLEPVVVTDPGWPRLAVWPVGDSVWLTGDWRRPGSINVVAFTDHVGVVDNARAVEAAASFFAGERVDDDRASWRGFLASVVRYAFEPWRPG